MAGSVRLCARCAAEFARPRGLSQAQWEGRLFCSKRCAGLRRQVQDAEIVNLYRSGLSSTEIATQVGVTSTQISRIIHAADGLIRSPSERQSIAQSKPEALRKKSGARLGIPCPEHVKQILSMRIGSANHNWRSGLTLTQGYLQFTASPANGSNASRYLHAVIAEWMVGRPLRPGEVVHHKDGNKLNNDPRNLTVMTQGEHMKEHARMRRRA